MSPKFLSVTHADLVEANTVEALNDAAVQAHAQRRDDADAAAKVFARLPTKVLMGGGVQVKPGGAVEETFSCACGKHVHGHGEDHNPFEGIIEPTLLEFLDPDDEARLLAERVNQARTPQTPPAATKKSSITARPPYRAGGGGRTNPNAGGRQRR